MSVGHTQSNLACLVCTMIFILGSFPTVDSFLSEEGYLTKYVAQVKVFLDYPAKANWKLGTRQSDSQLKADIQTVFDQMNIIFGRMKEYDLDIQLELKDIAEVKHYDEIIKGVNDYKVNGVKAVSSFEEWISHRYYKHEFDLALLFTGNDMYVGGSYTPYGVATDVGVACSARGVGIVEMFKEPLSDQKISFMARYTAHEIGHILGANHNDDEPLCKHQKGYLMAANAKFEGPNINNVTQCSVKSIIAYIKKITENGENCLLPDYSELTAADIACQDREKSDKWFMSRDYKEYGDKMCGNLKCISWDGKDHVYTKGKAAPDGLGCGKNKRCQKGECVDVQDGDPNIRSDDCPWGNQDLKKIGYGYSCESKDCDAWKDFCCAHCNALEKELERVG